jgi:hypothetical protein
MTLLSWRIIANSLTDDKKWTTCLYSRLVGRLMKHARSYSLSLATVHWCSGKASLASSGKSGVRQDEKKLRSGVAPSL